MADKLLSAQERKALLYGSLMGAGASALTAFATGANPIEMGMLGMSSGFEGGLNSVLEQKKMALEQQKSEELIRNMQENRKLGIERLDVQRQQTQETQRHNIATERISELLQDIKMAPERRRGVEDVAWRRYLESIEPGAPGVKKSPLNPELFSVISGMPPQVGQEVLGKILVEGAKPGKEKDKYITLQETPTYIKQLNTLTNEIEIKGKPGAATELSRQETVKDLKREYHAFRKDWALNIYRKYGLEAKGMGDMPLTAQGKVDIMAALLLKNKGLTDEQIAGYRTEMKEFNNFNRWAWPKVVKGEQPANLWDRWLMLKEKEKGVTRPEPGELPLAGGHGKARTIYEYDITGKRK